MMDRDAHFHEGAENPLLLGAESGEDLKVIAALSQDGVGKVGEAAYLRSKRRFVILFNRFRWEDKVAAERARRPYERVRAALTIENAFAVKARGIRLQESDSVYNLLDLGFEPGADGQGVVTLALSGGGAIRVEVEALDVTLEDLSRPWEARGAPSHNDD